MISTTKHALEREIVKAQIDLMPDSVFEQTVVMVPHPLALIRSIEKQKSVMPIPAFIATAVGHYIESTR